MANCAVLSSSSSSFTYDVFLSFRGEDTRANFTGNLYKSLQQSGIHTFIDDEGLKRGEEITPALLKAIEESRIAIIVFSKNYASSTFCLDELVKILEQLNGEGRLVWPIFYDVDPSEVRHQRGSYGDALSKHQSKFKNDTEKVQKWKLALREVANLCGWHFKQGHEYEYQFIGRIVKEISTRINRTPLHIASFPVGLESRVPKINSLLRVGSDDKVNMVGIYGVGGIGKTTIARAVYNSIADQFEGLCFLINIRENSTSMRGLVQLQEKLLFDLVREKEIKLGDVNQGIPIIKRRLHKKKVLIVLDDVDKVEQLQAIAGGCDWFGSGSRIIITTRDKHLLDTLGVEKMYEVKELNYHESRNLFCWNAFKREEPDPSYSDIANCVVDYAKGLPLALEIIGSNLFGKTIDEWKSALDRYRRIPLKRVRKVLKVSYDGLEEDEQEIFLDIACFFKGHTMGYVMDMVQHARGFHPGYGIRVLMDKSLVKIENDYVQMHDLIQDIGREIVRQQSPKEPGERSRLWSYEDIIRVLEENTGTNRVEVIILSFSIENLHSVHWSGKAFKKMKNLRILILENVTFSKGPEHLPNSLRVLKWSGYPSPSLPTNFHPEELFILRLNSSYFSLLKPLVASGFGNLTVLNFDQCKLITQIPDVSCLSNLREISLTSCENLVEIHHSIGSLGKLKILRASFCRKLRSFPPINLTNLEILWLDECSSLQIFPEILREIRNITELRLKGSDMEFPSSFQNLTGLQFLEMLNCKRIQLPIAFALLPELTLLHIHSCEELQFISKQDQGKEKASLLMCPNIEDLVLTSCNISDESLSTCLSWFCNVKSLALNFSNFTILPTCTKEFHFLRELCLDYCYCLREIRGVPPNIQGLSAQNCMLLSSQSTSILLSQELHDTGGKIFSLPGGRIPEWFDHCNSGGSISFWFRNKFPAIALCVVIGLFDELRFTVKFIPNVIINGNRQFHASGSGYTFSPMVDHIFVFDLQRIEFIDKVEEASLEKEWNHVEVSYVALFVSHGGQSFMRVPFEKYTKESGLYVFKQENSMEDIRFTNPYMDNEGNEICSPTPSEAVDSCLDFTLSSRTSDTGGYGLDLQQPQHSTTIKEDNGESPSKLLPLTKMRREKEQPTSNDESMMDDKGNDVVRSDQEGRWQFSFYALISLVASLCSSLTNS